MNLKLPLPTPGPQESDKVPFMPDGLFCKNLDTGSTYICSKKRNDGTIWIALDKGKMRADGRVGPDPKPVFIAHADFNANFKVIVPPKEEEPESLAGSGSGE